MHITFVSKTFLQLKLLFLFWSKSLNEVSPKMMKNFCIQQMWYLNFKQASNLFISIALTLSHKLSEFRKMIFYIFEKYSFKMNIFMLKMEVFNGISN